MWLLGFGDDDAVDQHARHLDRARGRAAALGDALDLGDDDAAGVACAAIAIARLSSVSASRSMVMLPSGSAVVPRMSATLIGNAL